MAERLLRLTEKTFRAQVVGLARALGWEVYGAWLSIHSRSGYPDLHLWHPMKRRSLWAELKTERGKLSDAQAATIETMRMAGLDVRIWRPSDWEEIENALK